MRATLYEVVWFSGRKLAGMSVCWEVDFHYWTSTAFRQGIHEGWGDMGRGQAEDSAQTPSEIVWLDEPLPLGMAECAVVLRNEKRRRRTREWVMNRRHGVNGHDAGNFREAYKEGRSLGEKARVAAERLQGRGYLLPEALAAFEETAAELLPVLQVAALMGSIRFTAAVAQLSGRRAAVHCRRCGSGGRQLHRTPCAACGRPECAYCEVCLTMGRCRECELLILGEALASVALAVEADDSETFKKRWKLSPAQGEAASTALQFLADRLAQRQKRHVFLLWAVTGAGKTEMMFPLLEAVLSAGGRAAVASPRRDVVLELAPRLAAAFPHVSRVVLYGGSEDKFENGALTLATTHQLIRFREAFDLIVLDEVDAFPYHNDPALHHAAAQARKKGGVTVLLSATPPVGMQRKARWGLLSHAKVSVRYHRRPLPVPKRVTIPAVSSWTGSKRRVPNTLKKTLQASIERGAQVFVFIPFIYHVGPLIRLFRGYAGDFGIRPEEVDGTSSRDPDRGTKVMAFRERTLRLLVTTTILERGVTIPKSDVFVLDADKPLFDAASLVQMAGRAGRSADDPNGSVYFAAPAWTSSQRSACRQIRGMNAFASRKGFLIKGDS
ncbi:DEAD/DEAH box helicase [Cohnella candidum]|uniref:DEAD/DEAH box helicase n=1 Tax=Cohnella candidum TaxID=2674991 RepID=A0A3G3K267_9BACL|nr:helicase-related protein [Cohnella candidum]AYQ74147.1 DEAD/DEAH box helicase [Cohnella candidum]